MTESYEDYEREYNSYLSRIRSFLAGTRSRSTLSECDRLLGQARKCATAMQGLAEVEGNQMKIREAQQRVDRDISPLAKEVQRALQDAGREELFYNAPNVDANNSAGDMQSLIQSSDDLLRESQALCMETEHIGNMTLEQMGRQREQMEGANTNITATIEIARQAKNILNQIGQKAFKNKVCLYIMIALLLIANFYAFKHLFHKKK